MADDVSAAWRAALERGATNMADPIQAYGAWIAWLNDADGNDVEIMSPIAAGLVEEALRTGQPFQIPAA